MFGDTLNLAQSINLHTYIHTFIAEDEVVGVDAVRLECDVHDVTDGRVDVLAAGASTTHGAAALRLASTTHVDTVHRWLDDRRVPVTRAIRLAQRF